MSARRSAGRVLVYCVAWLATSTVLVGVKAHAQRSAAEGAEPTDEAQPDRPAPAEGLAESAESVAESAESIVRLAEMRQRMAAMQAFDVRDGERTVAAMIADPLLRYNDTPRGCIDAILCGWGEAGRPLAVMSMELYPKFGRGAWTYAFVSLSERSLIVEEKGWSWSPTQGNFSPAAFPDAPAPSSDEQARLPQMQELVQRFSGYEYWSLDPSQKARYELHLLPDPVHRYRDDVAGIVDGGLFVMAFGANPEAILVLEAVEPAGQPAAWRYAFARLGHAEMHVQLDDREVWTQPLAGSLTEADPYWLIVRPMKGPAE